MGSHSYTYKSAAKRLNRSQRSIYDYVAKGFIKKQVSDNGTVLLSGEDVDQLAEEIGTDLPALNRKTFFQLQSRLRRLEEKMVLVQNILQIYKTPLRPQGAEAFALHRSATDAIKEETWSQEEITLWTDLLLRFDEATLDTIGDTLKLNKPWEVFYLLCVNMMKFCSKQYDKKPDIVWQSLHSKLDEGRKNLRATALMWIEAGRGTVSSSLIKEFETNKEKLIKSLVNGKNP
jgi:hypothetical protein